MALTKVSGDFIDAGSITQAHLHSSHGITTTHIAEGNKLFFTNARVDSRIGSLSSSDLSEGTNLYYTDARARAAISGTGSLSYNSTTGVMSFTMPAQNTSNITEGSNLYYTDARADARITAADTGDLSEGTNLYYTQARFNSAFTAKSTSDLSEGTNLYYTDARADARVALIVDSAPGTLNTLNELAAALGDDANFSTTVTNSIATKLPLAGGSLTGNLTIGGTSGSTGNALSVNRGSDSAQAMRIQNSGEVVIPSNYLYCNAAGTSLYVQNTAVFRGSIVNDGGDVTIGDSLSVTGTITCNNVASDKKIAFRRTGGNSFSIEHDSAFIYFYNETTSSVIFKMANNNNTTFTGTITATGGNSTQWNTAYGWGDHASGGYLTSSSTQSKYVRSDEDDTVSGVYTLTNSTTAATIQVTGHAGASNYNYFLNANNDGGTKAVHFVNGSTRTSDGGANAYTIRNDGGKLVLGNVNYETNITGSSFTVTPNATFAGIITASALKLQPSSTGNQVSGGDNVLWVYRQNNNDWGIQVDANNGTASDYGFEFLGGSSHTYAFSGVANGTRYFQVGSGFALHDGSFRAPIFYDSNDTNYYIDAAGTSSVSAINANGQFATTLANGFRVDSSSYARIELDSNSNWSYIRYQNNGTVSWDVAVYQGGQYELRPAGSGTNSWTYTSAGHAQAGASSRAPIFYDSNDTNYYTNPASTSVLNGLTVAGYSLFGNGLSLGAWYGDLGSNGYTRETGLSMTGGSEFVVVSKSGQGSVLVDGHYMAYESANGFFGSFNSTYGNLTGIRATAASTLKVMQLDGGNAILEVSQDVRAPIYYDVNDTNYYVNPGLTSSNSTSHSAKFRQSVQIGDSGSYNQNDGGWGARLIVSDGVHARIDVAQDANGMRSSWYAHTGHSGSLFGTITGHDQWLYSHNAKRQTLFNGYSQEEASYRAPIFYDSNDTAYYLDPATGSVLKGVHLNTTSNTVGSQLKIQTSSNHQYPQIFSNGGYEAMWNYKNNVAEWYVGVRTSSQLLGNTGFHFYNTTSSQTVGGWDISGHSYSIGSSRAPIFYDSNDTTYYIDPATTSSIVNLAIKGDIRFPTSSGATHARGTQSYGIYQESGSWAHPFPDLNIGFHTGISIGAYGSYGGIRFFTNSDMATQIMSVGNFSDGLGGGNVYINDKLQVGTDVRAPIFYDVNNTAYRVDAGGTTELNVLNVGGVIDANGGHGGINITHTSILASAASNWTGNPGGAGKIQYHANRWYIVADSSSNRIVQFRRDGSDVSYIDNSGRLVGAPDLRAPLFYDSNDTTYYIDPASNSRLNTLDFNHSGYYIKKGDWGPRIQSPYGWIQFGPANSGHAHIYTDRSNFYFNKEIYINGGSLLRPDDIRSRVFYDLDNTNYNVDAASTSNLNALTLVGTLSGQNAYFAQDVAIGFTSGNIGGNLNVKNSAAGQIAAKLQLGASTNSGSTGVFINTTASYAGSGMFLHFQSNHISGDDNVLIAYLDGDIVNKNNSYTQYSDQRLKENIVDATPKLEEIKQIKVRNFNFIGEDLKQIGVVAQELEPIFPALVKEREVPGHDDPIKTVKYSVMVPILIKAMQEQQTIIDDLKARLETLENQ